MQIIYYRTLTGHILGYRLELSGKETAAWARRPSARWPCSIIAGRRLAVEVDANGLTDCKISGNHDLTSDELSAIIPDHMSEDCGHLWPKWRN